MSSLKILNNHIVEKKFREWEAAQKDKDPELAVALVKWAVRIVNQCPDLLEIDEDGVFEEFENCPFAEMGWLG